MLKLLFFLRIGYPSLPHHCPIHMWVGSLLTCHLCRRHSERQTLIDETGKAKDRYVWKWWVILQTNGPWKIRRSEAEIRSSLVHPDSGLESKMTMEKWNLAVAQGRSQKSILERTALFENGAAWNHVFILMFAREIAIYRRLVVSTIFRQADMFKWTSLKHKSIRDRAS